MNEIKKSLPNCLERTKADPTNVAGHSRHWQRLLITHTIYAGVP